MIDTLRKILWRLLGVDRQHILRSVDFVFLRNDKFTSIDKRTYENGAKVWRWTDAPIVIGKYCSIANNVNFIVDGANHSISKITSFPIFDQFYSDDEKITGIAKHTFLEQRNERKGIELGNDVWVGMNTLILPGVKIGSGVTIASGSVVTKDIEDYTVVAGNPAKLIKHKCSLAQKEALNKISWWNWNDDIIKDRAIDFLCPIDQFIDKYINADLNEGN